MEQYRTYYSWQEAMQLSLLLYRQADDLPDEEQHLLASDLRRAAVEVPTQVAENLMSQQPASLSAIIKLQIIMELIGKVYPALDTADTEKAVNMLAGRLQDPNRFMEVLPQPVAPAPAADEDEEDEDDEIHIGVE
jgi:hypothetical protein